MDAIKLRHAGELKDGTIRLQSQLRAASDTADFILQDGVLKCWGHGAEGFAFYESDHLFEIIHK